MSQSEHKKEQKSKDNRESRRMNAAAVVVGLVTLGLVIAAIALKAGISLPIGQADDGEPGWLGTWRKGYGSKI